MSEINDSQLRRLDVTLLLVFEETMATRKLSAAAGRLGLTQSAISHALRRLRDIFGDELFVRLPHGVRPTGRAEALRAPLAEATRLLAGAVRPVTFDPAASDRIFRVAANDYTTAMFSAQLTNGLDRAFGPRFVFRALVREEALAALRAAELDVALGLFRPRGDEFQVDRLFDDDYRVVARANHPAFAHGLTAEAFGSAGHVLVAPGGTLEGIVDRALAATGLYAAGRAFGALLHGGVGRRRANRPDRDAAAANCRDLRGRFRSGDVSTAGGNPAVCRFDGMDQAAGR